MKIEVNSTLAMDVNFSFLTTHGGLISIYFAGGTRYQHWAEWTRKGAGGISFEIINEENGEIVGNIEISGETEEEKEIFNLPIWTSREKETQEFLFIPDIATKTFQHSRWNW